MFFASMTIPPYYENVRYAPNQNGYEDIINKIINSCNNKSINDHTILLGDYPMVKKSFSELYDKNTNSKISLLKKIDFIITSDENGFYYENRNLNLYVYGETQKEAEDNIYEELLFQYNNYAIEEDSSLDLGAINLKYNLLSIINLDAKI